MRKMFLASLFHQSAALLPKFHPDLAGKKVCLIPAAAVPEAERWHVDKDREALEALGLIATDLEISTAPPELVKTAIASADILFVTGGNTFFLLREMRRSGADKLIVDHIDRSKLYVSTSAGSIVVSKDVAYARHLDPVEKAPLLGGDFTGLGLVDFGVVPHKTTDPFRGACETIRAECGGRLDVICLDDDEAVTVLGDRHETFSAKGLGR